MSERDDIAWLRSLTPFQSMTKSEARQLLAQTTTRTWKRGEAVVRRGEPGDSMFVIREGGVDVRIVGDDDRLRFTVHLAEGDVFGEMALLTGEPRTADVIVEDAPSCTCLIIHQKTLQPELKKHPALASFLTEILGKRLIEADAMRTVGKYHIVRELGRGAMATVFEGYHPGLNRGVAIKMLSHSLVYRTDIAKRFRNEAKLMASLRHEGIVHVYDTEAAYGTNFIIMEKLEGMDLERMLRDHGPMDFNQVRMVVLRTAEALQYAHDSGIIHRDIKPSNIFRLPDGTLKLVDFGIATGAASQAEDEHELLCSPAFVAPEVINGRRVDGRSDIYSLGITAYKLLVGEAPFQGKTYEEIFEAHQRKPLPNLEDVLPGIPRDLRTFVERATQKKPKDRFEDAAEVAALLDRDNLGNRRDLKGVAVTLHYPAEERERVHALIQTIKESLSDTPRILVSVGDLEQD